MLIALSEQRLSRWATVAAAASFILPLLGLLLMFGAVSAAAGDYGITSTKGFWIGWGSARRSSRAIRLAFTRFESRSIGKAMR
jgi:hypothetical protein